MNRLDYQSAYRRNLPHIQPPGATFFVTFRLDGSLPQEVIALWNRKRQWLTHLKQSNRAYYDRVKEDFERAWFQKFKSLLDGATFGPVWLQEDQVASIVAESLHHRHKDVYRLDAFTIMPNHVHAVIRPLPIGCVAGHHSPEVVRKESQPDDVEYHSLLPSCNHSKGSAFKANKILSREGGFRAHESYDHWIRNDEEWQRIVAHVLNNPLKAGYVKHWQDWKWNYRRA